MSITLCTDTFNRADSASTLGSTDGTNALRTRPWTPQVGTWGISSNQAYNVSNTLGAYALVGLYTPDVDLSIAMTALSAVNNRNEGIVFRWVDSNNYWNFRVVTATTWQLQEVSSGAGTTWRSATITPVAGDVLRVVAVGPFIRCYRNGVLLFTHESAIGMSSGYAHGIRTNTSTARMDNWSATTPSIGTVYSEDSFRRTENPIANTDGVGTLDPTAWTVQYGSIKQVATGTGVGGGTVTATSVSGVPDETGNGHVAYTPQPGWSLGATGPFAGGADNFAVTHPQSPNPINYGYVKTDRDAVFGATAFSVDGWWYDNGDAASHGTGDFWGMYSSGSANDFSPYSAGTDPDNLNLGFASVGVGDMVLTPFMSRRVWHHCAWTWDGTNWRVYLDGTLVLTNATHPPGSRTGTPSFSLAGDSAIGTWYGSCAGVAFYSAVLTGGQIAAHVAANTSWAAYKAAVLADSPSALWGLNQLTIGTHITTMNVGVADGKVQCTNVQVTNNTNLHGGLTFRFTNINNYWWVEENGSGSVVLGKRVATVNTILATVTGFNTINTATLAVVMNGSSIEVYRAGVLVIAVTDGFNITATRHGLYGNDSGNINPPTFSFQSFLAFQSLNAVADTSVPLPTGRGIYVG